MFVEFKKSIPLYSWALYDFANTIFSAVVLTFYFPLYLTSFTAKNLPLGLATTAAMVLAGLVVPWLGALTDRTGKTKASLVLATILCVAFTSAISFSGSIPLLFLEFLLACFFFHASLVFYNALLPVIEAPKRQGFASGLGTALGYLGVLFSLPIAHGIDSVWGRRFVFGMAGGLFLLFALPLFFWVPERRVAHPVPPSFSLFWNASKRVARTVRSITRKPSLLFFFLGNFFVVEALNTVIFWFIIYVDRVFHPRPVDLITLFLGLNGAAFFFGILAGFLTDAWGSRKTLLLASGSLFVTFLLLALTKHLGIFVAVSLTGGALGLAGIWTAGRKRVVELSPREEVGEYFGLYNLTTKVSVTSSLIFSILADQWGFRAALLSQLVPSGLGLLFLWMAQEETPSSAET